MKLHRILKKVNDDNEANIGHERLVLCLPAGYYCSYIVICHFWPSYLITTGRGIYSPLWPPANIHFKLQRKCVYVKPSYAFCTFSVSSQPIHHFRTIRRTSRKLLMCSAWGNMCRNKRSPVGQPKETEGVQPQRLCPKQELKRGGGGGGCCSCGCYSSATATGVDEWRETIGGPPPPCAPKVTTRRLEVLLGTWKSVLCQIWPDEGLRLTTRI